ncbi:unnamed protein product, partial [Phaedon cochleariae]
NPDSASADPSQNLTLSPLRQAITTIEHKIRNLEKRKSKLESYRELQNAGKELNSDQKTAVAKYTEVISTLDFARDLCKQFLGIAVSTEKEAKKSAKKEAAAKYQAELARLREILLVQDALNQMGNENVRDDFLHGRNGAAQLSETDLKLLDDLYPAVTPKHEAGNPTAFTNEVQAAAEHLLAAVDGKQKEVFGGSYSQIKEILGKIHESGYFDQAQIFEGYTEPEAIAEEPEEPSVEQLQLNNHETQQPEQPEELAHPAPPVDTAFVDQPPLVEQPPLAEQPPLPPVVEAVAPPEQIFYQQIAQPPPLRPITEMLGTGSFFFLQESEIDPPEQIPSQTYTNQNFGAPLPHAAVPLPPHFATKPASMPPLPPNNHHLQQGPPQSVGNNGLDEQEEHHKDLGQGRSANATSFYHNNGYSARQQQRQPNPNRSGGGGGGPPRPANRHH